MEIDFNELETNWMKAWKNKDEATCRELLSDDFVLTSSLSSGKLVNKEEWIEKALFHYNCEAFTIKELKTNRYNDAAVLNILFNQKATANGKDWSGDFLLTDVWILQDHKWRVVSRHASWLR